MLSRIKGPFAMLALIAALVAEVFGMNQGYVCVCDGGDPVVTSATHCHVETGPCEDAHNHGAGDAERNEETTAHEVNQQDFLATFGAQGVHVPLPALALIPELFQLPVYELHQDAPTPRHLACWEIRHIVPPPSLVVAHSTVFLV